MLYVEAMNLMAWYFAREISRDYQNLDVVPTALTDTSIAELSGPRIERFGFSFQVPWKDIEKDRTMKTAAALAFKQGGRVIVLNPASGVNGAEILRGTTSSQYRLMSRLLGSKALSSNYELMVAEVQATPGGIKWWGGRVSNSRELILLGNKGMNLGKATAIHSIGSGDVRGFQYGDPDVAPYVVKLDLFDATDKHYEFHISGKDEDRPVISQAQINGLVASLHESSGTESPGLKP
jgi:hypothetical protein